MNIFQILFYQPIYNLIVIFYNLFGSNLGLAIIAVAVLSRMVLIPVTRRQIRMAESSREFNEKSKEIKKKYKKDKEKQQKELMELQRQYLPAQLGGCLPLIFQLVFFINIYSAIRNLVSNGAEGFNNVAYSFVEKFPEGFKMNYDFVGIWDLDKSPSGIKIAGDLLPYLLLVLFVGITQYSSMKILTGFREKRKKKNEQPEKKKKKKKKKDDGMEDFGEIMQRSTKSAMMIMPVFLMFVSFGLPSGLSIYLITTSSFVILQQSFFFWLDEKKEKKQAVITTRQNEKK